MAESSGAGASRIRGGRLQKRKRLREELAAAGQRETPTAASSQHQFDSSLAFHLVQQWAWGFYSAPQVQVLAARAYEDQRKLLRENGLSEDLAAESLHYLAAMGKFGRYPGNIARELKNWLQEPKCPKPLVVNITIRVHKPRRQRPAIAPRPSEFMLPHAIFADMFRNERAEFYEKFLGGSLQSLSDFWEETMRRRDPRLVFHPMCTRPRWQQRAVPIMIHGDAVPVIRVGRPGTQSLECISMQPVLAYGKTLSVKMLLFSIFEKCKVKGHTDRIWEVLAWSFATLFNGVFPESDRRGMPFEQGTSDHILAGQPLCGDNDEFFGVLWCIKGSQVWMTMFSNVADSNTQLNVAKIYTSD